MKCKNVRLRQGSEKEQKKLSHLWSKSVFYLITFGCRTMFTKFLFHSSSSKACQLIRLEHCLWLPVASKTWWRQKSLVLDWWKKKAFCLCAVENVRLNISSMTNYKVAHTFWLVKRFYFTWLETRKCKWNLLSDKLSGIDFSLNFFPLAIKAHSVFFLESFLKSQLGKSNVFFHSFLFCFIRYKLFSWESNLLENVF
jgi:hypothetical protein